MDTHHLVALILMIVYFAFIIGLSMYRRLAKTELDFFLADRKFPHWILAISFAASWFGGASALVSADKEAYTGGLSAYFVMGGPTIVSTLVLLSLAARIRLLGPISQPEITENRYSRTARIIQSVIIWWYMTTWAASQMIAAAGFVSGFFGLAYVTALLIIVAIVWFYCMFGGFKSVVTTDLGQFLWIVVALVIVVIAAAANFGGFGKVARIVREQDNTKFFNILGDFKYSLFYIISFTFAWVISAEIWQRFSAARSVADARKISRGALYINIPLYLFAVVIGMMAVGLLGGKDLEGGHVMTRIILGYVPPVLAGIAFAGLLAAVMSTMDTAINTGSLVLTEDFYHKMINPRASERSILIFARIAATIMALLGILVSVLIRDLLWVLWMASDILAAGVFWPLLLGMYTKWGTNPGAIASMLAGSLYVLWQYLIDLGVGLPSIIPAWPGRSWPFSIFWGIVIGFVVFTVVSLLTRTAREKERADRFFASLKEAKG
jgi:SSS family solute:Na+ symporter